MLVQYKNIELKYIRTQMYQIYRSKCLRRKSNKAENGNINVAHKAVTKYCTHGYINKEKKYIINCLECKEIELYKSLKEIKIVCMYYQK